MKSRRFIDIYNTEQTKVRRQVFVKGTVNYTSADSSWNAGGNVRNIFDLRRGQAAGYAQNVDSQLHY